MEDNKAFIASMIEKARAAQAVYETFDQQQVDAIVRAVGKVIFDNAEMLARMAVEETRMGVYEDKVKKNQGKSRIIWHSLKNVKSRGIIKRDTEKCIVEIAKPVGVVGAVTPTTNPIVTPMCNAMFALKGGNAIIFAPHPRAKHCTRVVTDMLNDAIMKLGAPANLIQTIDEVTVDLTGELMRQVDVVVATGGMGMVKAAYSSGKPAFGVGAGNVQCILDRGIDYEAAVKKAIEGRIFDNGIICSGEQTIIAPREDYDRIIALMEQNGARYVSDPAEKERLRKTLFDEKGVISRLIVGQSVAKVAEMAGIEIAPDTKVLVVEADGIGREDILCKEKMCPVMASFRYDSFEDAVAIAQANLNVEGRGHSVSLHSDNEQNVEYAGEHLAVSRVLINQICSTQNGGAFTNNLTPTTTLGCGSWGNNSISENLSYRQLINVSRIAYAIPGAVQPSDAEIWG